jgi:hypothetical protein
VWNFHRFSHSGLVISFIEHMFSKQLGDGNGVRAVLASDFFAIMGFCFRSNGPASLQVCEFDALRASYGVGRTVEAWPRHHVITLLLGFVLHKAEDFVASFRIQHVCHSLCLLLLLPSSQRLAPAAMSHSGATINSPHTGSGSWACWA